MRFRYRLFHNLPKTLEKKTKTDKNILKMIIFHQFEHSSSPIPIIKQNKNKLARNRVRESYYFVQF